MAGVDQVKAVHDAGLFASSRLLVSEVVPRVFVNRALLSSFIMQISQLT